MTKKIHRIARNPEAFLLLVMPCENDAPNPDIPHVVDHAMGSLMDGHMRFNCVIWRHEVPGRDQGSEVILVSSIGTECYQQTDTHMQPEWGVRV